MHLESASLSTATRKKHWSPQPESWLPSTYAHQTSTAASRVGVSIDICTPNIDKFGGNREWCLSRFACQTSIVTSNDVSINIAIFGMSPILAMYQKTMTDVQHWQFCCIIELLVLHYITFRQIWRQHSMFFGMDCQLLYPESTSLSTSAPQISTNSATSKNVVCRCLQAKYPLSRPMLASSSTWQFLACHQIWRCIGIP